MSSEEEGFDPFNPPPPQQADELKALANALRLARQFSLIFARCNQMDERERIIAELVQRLPETRIQQIKFEAPIVHLLRQLRERIETPAPDAIFVLGLENSLSFLAQHGSTRFVANLNAARNSFGVYIPCPLVLWIPEYMVTAISRGAPDFFSVRSGLYRFDTPLPVADSRAAGTYEELDPSLASPSAPVTISAEEKERLAHQYDLLSETRRLPADRRDIGMELRLTQRIGDLCLRQGLYSEAQSAFEQMLSIAILDKDERAQALAWNALGRVDRHLAQESNDSELLKRSLVMHERSLNIYRALQAHDSEANVLLSRGRTLRALKRDGEAEEAYRESIRLFGEANELYGYAHALNHLGTLLRDDKRAEEARRCHEEALTIYRRITDREGEATTLNYLGLLDRSEERWLEAEVNYKASLRIWQELNDERGQRIALDNLSALRNLQGDTSGAKTISTLPTQGSDNATDRSGIEWVMIPAGEFLMGDDDMEDNPRHAVYLDAYQISKTPITVGQYLEFCDLAGHEKPEPPDFNSEWKCTDHPIVNVSWHDAMAYCKWLSQTLGKEVTLPTEAQWEKAARGTDGRLYPWGNDWAAGRLHCSKQKWGDARGTAPVGSYPSGANPYGLLDMAGNVWEWCLDWYDAEFVKRSPKNNPINNTNGKYRVLRGGSWVYDLPGSFRSSIRDGYDPTFRNDDFGFRVVSEP